MTWIAFLVMLLVVSVSLPPSQAASSLQGDPSTWKIKEVYSYLSAVGEDLSPEEAGVYCQFIIDCQDPQNGAFVDAEGGFIYSVKGYYLVKRFGYEPKYPLSVCEPPYRNETSEEVSEKMSVAGFREWLDHIYQEYDAYGAGSLRGHFIAPHVMNLQQAGKPVENSPYVQEFKRWILENQKENGFWNRPDDSDYSGWNGMMKMDQAFGLAGLPLPHPERMIRTVLRHQDLEQGTFTSAGGCTNHNALHTLRHCSKDNGLILWPEIFRAMERHAEYLEKRYDPATGMFRPPPGFQAKPDEFSTDIAASEAGNLIDYCGKLLDPSNAPLVWDAPQETSPGEKPITPDRVRALLVRAVGLATLSREKTKEIEKAKHEAQ